jgi:hypothetical protein
MPILSYFAVIGSVLVALLFVADATLEKSGPLPFNNESVGLPKPWRPDTTGSILTTALAPEPDMASAAVRAAAPTAPQSSAAAPTAPPSSAAVPAAAPAAKPEPVRARTAKVETAAKKPKHVARRQPRPDGPWRNYAWSRNGNDGGFFGGGNSMFGRF